MKVNTTLTTLDLKSVQQRDNDKPNTQNQTAINKADSKIDEEGARALSEALKVNTTLLTLELACAQSTTWQNSTKTQHHQR